MGLVTTHFHFYGDQKSLPSPHLLLALKPFKVAAVPSPLPGPQGREHPQITVLLYHCSHTLLEELASCFFSHTPLVFPHSQPAGLKQCSLNAN